jgi:DNA-binding MarR family transcriptional regulator
LSAIVSGNAHARASRREQELTDQDLKHVAKNLVRIAQAISRLGGEARNSSITAECGMTPGNVSTALKRLASAGYIEQRALSSELGHDGRARVCRLLPLGERLVAMHPDGLELTGIRVRQKGKAVPRADSSGISAKAVEAPTPRPHHVPLTALPAAVQGGS